jgi:BclB C-terminal domain-containing protein
MADMNKRGPADCDDCCDGEGGERGKRGKRGPRGHRGHDGRDGAAAIIPFASGAPVELSEILDVSRIGAVIGFGSSGPTLNLLGGSLDLTGGPGLVLDMAWVLPDNGTLVQLAAMYSNVVAINLDPGSAAVNVQLYSAPSGSNTFLPIGPVLALAPSFTGALSLGDTATGTIALGDIAVSAGDRLILVAFVATTGFTALTALTGYISAGLKIT